MADEQRLTKKERLAQARAERKEKEALEAQRARRQRWTTYGVTALILLGVGAIVWQAFAGGDETIEGETIAQADYEQAREAASCEVISDQPLEARDHLDPAGAPPADVIYANAPRPTHSGPHFSATHPVVEDGLESQGEERALTHNLEHGAVIVWYDPEQVEDGTVSEIENWAEALNESGFSSQGGGAIFVSPYTEPGIQSGKPIALRAWGIAVDCGEWNETVGEGFVIEHYGTHGRAPENALSPYPEGVLAFADRDVEDNPQGGEETHAPEPTDAVTEGATAPATEQPTPAES